MCFARSYLRSGRAASLLGTLLVLAATVSPRPARGAEVGPLFENFAALPDEPARTAFLTENAGRTVVEGSGRIEAAVPRTYFDTSVPHTNPTVALIHLGPGRKIVCGLPGALHQPERRLPGEGTTVSFRGRLVDAHDWGEWTTLYLADCDLQTE